MNEIGKKKQELEKELKKATDQAMKNFTSEEKGKLVQLDKAVISKKIETFDFVESAEQRQNMLRAEYNNLKQLRDNFKKSLMQKYMDMPEGKKAKGK